MGYKEFDLVEKNGDIELMLIKDIGFGLFFDNEWVCSVKFF